MAGWEQWVDFVHGTAANKYAEVSSNPATWYIAVCHMTDGDLWASSAGYPGEFQKNDLNQMSKAAVGEETNIFGQPPVGYTILRAVPCDCCEVLSGKSKTVPGRQLFAARSTGTLIIGIVDIEDSTKGAEAQALSAFAYGVEQAIASGI